MLSFTMNRSNGLDKPFSPMAFFENKLRARNLREDIEYEGVGNYVFFCAAELEAVLAKLLPLSQRGVSYLVALILYELINSGYSKEWFIERTMKGLMRILNNESNRDYILQFKINRLSETWHVARLLTGLEPELDWLYHWLTDTNQDMLSHCDALIELNIDFMYRGRLHGQYVFQPFVMD